MIDIGRIVSIKTMRKRVEEAALAVKEVEKPMLLDWSIISGIYESFMDHVREQNDNPSDYTRRRQFLFISLYLFAPKVLAGGSMPTGLRDRLCDAIGLKSRSILSNQARDLLFYYQEYRDFRNGVDEAYAYICERMGLMDKRNESL